MSSLQPLAAPGPPASPVSPDRDTDSRYYADLLWRSRTFLVAAAIGGLGLGVLMAELQVPSYRARALLQVSPPTPTSMTVTDALVGTGNPIRDRQFFNTQLNVLSSRTLAERVMEKLKLGDKPPFAGAKDAAGLFVRRVQIEPVPETFVIEVRVNHEDPKEAALWANALADAYIDHSIEGQMEAARRAYDWVNERLADTQRNMQEAQDKLLKSYQGQDIFVPDGSVSAVTTSITKLSEDQVLTQARRIALEAELSEISDMKRRGHHLDAVPQVATDKMVQDLSTRLETLSLDLTRLKEKYKEAHPEVQKIQVQLDQTRKAKNARALQIEDGLRAEYRQLQRREVELRAEMDNQKSQAVAQSRKLTELESLKKRADSATNLYTVLLQKLNETNIAASIQNNNVRLLDRAVVPQAPIWPEKRKIAVVGLLLGLAMGATYLLLRDYLSNTIRDAEDIERFLHLDLLAAVPRHSKDNVHLVTEAYQTLRTALLFGRKAEAGQVVLITGTAPGEGKTTTVLNVAKLLAVSGESTVILDGDLRRASLHQRLNLPREPGLIDLFTKPVDVSALIQTTKTKNLFTITAGPLPPNPPAILARADVATRLQQLRRHFRWVLIDSPPLAAVTDALLLARHADMTVLVVQHDAVDKKIVKRSLAALRKVTPVLGAVLNAVDVKTRSHYYYYRERKQNPKEATGRRPRPVGQAEVNDALV
jgi:succinoglycan biosynthesis transport protein ExoP